MIAATQPAAANFAPAEPRDRPLPIMLVHGTKDPLVPYAGGMASMWGFRRDPSNDLSPALRRGGRLAGQACLAHPGRTRQHDADRSVASGGNVADGPELLRTTRQRPAP